MGPGGGGGRTGLPAGTPSRLLSSAGVSVIPDPGEDAGLAGASARTARNTRSFGMCVDT
jgi:hypothetical protein